MIKKIELTNFKKFVNQTIELKPQTLSLIVGGNNSGKSTILHALAVWEYCKTVLVYEKSPSSILTGFHGDGYGVNIDDFTPINIPSLKYLWTNLNPTQSYSLSIKCFWDIDPENERFLKIGLALTQERLFIKPLESNILLGEHIPKIAYLPPFAGITDKEQWYTPAYRNKLIGQGLAGAVLRNTIIELFAANQALRAEKKARKSKISTKDLELIRNTDSFEKLNQVLFETFKGIIEPQNFNPDFHTNIKVDFIKGKIENKRFVRFKNYNKRDIMVEGSGFLQWLSVYTFAVDPKIDVLLLDEPDAHLHNYLQNELIGKLRNVSSDRNKQVLIATHSTEVIKNFPYELILQVNQSVKYLTQEKQKVKVLSGLGTEYFPKLESIQRHKKVLFAENGSDINILKAWTAAIGLQWPDSVIDWTLANNHKDRQQLFLHLKDEINGLKCISIVDRDNDLYENTNSNLHESYSDCIIDNSEFRFRKWRRWEIENYLICPTAIARCANKTEDEIRGFISDNFRFDVHQDYKQSERKNEIRPLFDEGKPVIETICEHFKITKVKIAKEMTAEEICDDPITLIREIFEF